MEELDDDETGSLPRLVGDKFGVEAFKGDEGITGAVSNPCVVG